MAYRFTHVTTVLRLSIPWANVFKQATQCLNKALWLVKSVMCLGTSNQKALFQCSIATLLSYLFSTLVNGLFFAYFWSFQQKSVGRLQQDLYSDYRSGRLAGKASLRLGAIHCRNVVDYSIASSTEYFFKCANPGLFLFIIVFSTWYKSNIYWLKHSWFAWNLNPGQQDGRLRWIPRTEYFLSLLKHKYGPIEFLQRILFSLNEVFKTTTSWGPPTELGGYFCD